MHRDEDAVIHVFEAMIVGVLVLTAILFMTALSAPSQSESSGGIDLARISADTLAILEDRDAEDPSYQHRLDELVSLAMQGDRAEATAFLEEVMPSGTRFLLRLDNGVEPITLLPEGTTFDTTPRNARGAEVFLMPDWTAHAGNAPDACGSPGSVQVTDCAGARSAFDFSAWTTLTAPDGSTTAPDGGTWLAWWEAKVPGEDRIPANVPYGLWQHDGGYLRIQSDLPTDHAVYAVQLLVWPGA